MAAMMYFAPKFLEMREVVADALNFLYAFRKPTPDTQATEMSFRALACTWQRQPLYSAGTKPIKGRRCA